ncbi:protein bark beetle-like isoform X4 [Homarus americanus]|uniref:protein bark beetle-like isoform X4 n=1 Tax=Homarus americanus TaxID=6706 RepID=UPI001C48CB3C|nr:protein bark beetle-like isoform X4 [Homarus americanus]
MLTLSAPCENSMWLLWCTCSMAVTRCRSMAVIWWTAIVMVVLAPPVLGLGGTVSDNVVYDVSGSPYVVTQDILIQPGGRLTIEPGVTVQFDPGVGVTVKGVLHAEGTSMKRITFTSSQPPSTPLPKPTLRLVDGPTPLQGRLQMFYKDKWRSICTNSRNWTAEDMTVGCRQMGYSGGKYWEWQDRANNDTSTILYEAPLCTGLEDDITKCAWHTHSMGGGVCDMHPDLGLDCEGYHALWRGTNHWRGILFHDAEFEGQLFQEKTLYQKVSKSVLSYVDLEYAGMGPKREVESAVMSRRVPPRISHVTINSNAFNGINITLPDTFVHLQDATIKANGGYGVYVNTSTGSVLIDESSVVMDNNADGVKYNFHHREPNRSASDTFQDFCAGASNPNQAYPIVTVATQDKYSFKDITCVKSFYIRKSDFVFTVHFSYMQTEEDGAGTVEVRDRDEGGDLLSKFELKNHTFPSSVVSRGNTIWIKFTAKSQKLSFIFMEVVASKYKMFDLSLHNSLVGGNIGHGVAVENLRSLVHIHQSNLTANIFGSGLNVKMGAGDVNVTHSTINKNIGDGVNITYEGGLQNVTWSNIADNTLRGVAVWFNESGLDTKIQHKTSVAYSIITGNLDVGLRIGNFCRDALVNISSNTFTEGHRAAIEIESCWLRDGGRRTVQIGQNLFQKNHRLAVKITPAVNMNLSIEYNEFQQNDRGTVMIYNEDKVELPSLPFVGHIVRNHFRDNTGWFVLRLTLSLRGLDQTLRVEKNTIKDNVVKELYINIQSRSRASGVICVGSSNIILYRNLIENPGSFYEISSHTTDQSTPINATYNWLGNKFERVIFDRIFDRRDRYNLALVVFHPFLLSSNNVETPVTEPGQMSEPNFFDPVDNHIIGGEVNGEVTLHDGVYTVTRDIYVHETGTLTIAFGTTLEFAEGMGMMVAGLLRTEGSGKRDVRFTLQGTTEEETFARAALYAEEEVVVLNGTEHANITTSVLVSNVTEGPVIPVKLVGGKNDLEGRLMVYVGGEWGTVCNHGWTQDAAAAACQQMGHVLNPEDWFLEPGHMPPEGQTARILLSNVQCDEFDTDITRCKSDASWELENSCSHAEDVGIRCYPCTWAGIRLGMTAHESHIKGVIIEKAGLLDYTTRSFKPALQIDFHHHVIQDIEVRDNSQDGVGVIYSNQYAIANPDARVFKGCSFSRNKRHGISVKQMGVNITDSELQGNDGSGIHFNPFLSRADQRELTGWLKLLHDRYRKIPDTPKDIQLTLNEPEYFITQTLRGADTKMTIHVSTSHSNVIGIQVLNPITPESTEMIVIYDYQKIIESQDIARWDLRGDQVAFPTTSGSYAITIEYSSGPYALGDVIFVLTAIDRRDIAQAGDLRNFRAKWPMLYIDKTNIQQNDIGISTLHYNRYLTDDGDHLMRCANESMVVINSKIINNNNQAVYTLSPFRVMMDNDDIAEITFMFNGTTISGNGRGIDQYSWDVRESNNLFHWVLQETVMENNGGGGIVLTLPYVWQYTENFTHTIYINQSSFLNNVRFQFLVDGHFARINMTDSKFETNTCEQGLISLQGMEKEMFIYDNTITSNIGSYVVEFNTNSQSDILGVVQAHFEYNKVQRNRHALQLRSSPSRAYQPASYTIAVRGLQKINITHNQFGSNEMDYELLAGLFTSRIDNYLNVEANWWGSRDPKVIEERIFDFDDWNNFALADYLPYLIEDNLRAPVSSVGSSTTKEKTMDLEAIGGRLLHDLRLTKRSEPYVIKSDLTVMPGVTLVIEAGATLEFFPSVGMLVLGRLEAVGVKHNRITMRPVDTSTATHYRVGRHTKSSLESVRLCVEGDCDGRRDGFLDIFNGTTKQWVPICDNRFTERNAQVVCNQLGHNIVNVFHGRNKRTEMFPNALIRIRSWPDPIQCDGTEMALNECSLRMNGQIFNHTYECSWNGDFVYISCGDLNLENENEEYWGGIRFSIPNFEHMDVYQRIHNTNSPEHAHAHPLVHGNSHTTVLPSVMKWVNIEGAGILHNDKSPAILSFHETPKLRGVTIRNSAYDGLSIVSAKDGFDMLYNKFQNNLGVGVTLMGLTGETRETEESSFFPLTKLRLPYHMFGMVDICDSSKELRIEERIILYYKYDNRPVDCVKIFSSVFNVKNFGFRLLQFNLYDSTVHTDDPVVKDRIVLYDGDVYNYTTVKFAEIHMNSGNHMRFFKTEGTSLSVEVHATGASGDLGFVAEIVTLPISDLGINRNILHNFTYNEYYDNAEGAFFTATAGEVHPWMCLSYSRLENNGRQLYANFTTTRAAVYLDLQNMQDVYIKNNVVRNNTGGVYINAGSMGSATKLQANVTNNLFEDTLHWPALFIASKENSAYQHALIAYNDFSWSYSPYHDVITLAQVVSVFTHNYLHSNIGRHILDIYGFQKVRLPVYQTTSHNSFAKNMAMDPTYQGTIIAGSAGQQFVDNVFYNLDNAYELVAVNESVSDVWKTPIDARDNWWGFNTSVAVSGRIHDKTDDVTLLRVDYSQWKLNNYSLLQGCEPGYTRVGDACYLYIGGPVTHEEAKAFCKRDNASLPFLQKWYWEVQYWLLDQQPEYLWEYDMVWVQHLDVIRGCAAFVYRQVRSVDCNLNLPFICESDPDKTIDKFAWTSDPLAVAAITVTFGCLILVAACVSCWVCKSRNRRKERIMRRNSIRASIRSNRSALSTTSGGFSDIGRRRIIEEPQRAVPMKGGGSVGGASRMNGLHGSFDSISKSNFNSSVDEDPSFVVYEETTQSPPGYTSELDNRFSADPNLENACVTELLHPSFNMTFQNHGFRDNSSFNSRENGTFTAEARAQQWNGSNNNIPPSSCGQPTFSTYGHAPRLPSTNHQYVPLPRPPGDRPLPPIPIWKGSHVPSHSYSVNNPYMCTFGRPLSLHGTTSSFKNESLRGSNPQLAVSSVATDSTLEMKKDLSRDTQDPHLTATLPRDQAPPFHYVSADVLSGRQSSTPSEDSQDYFSQGRSQSQPLETAM